MAVGASEVAFEKAPPAKADEAEFIMLRDGGIAFEGNASELREVARAIRTSRVSVVRTDYATHTIACLVGTENRHRRAWSRWCSRSWSSSPSAGRVVLRRDLQIADDLQECPGPQVGRRGAGRGRGCRQGHSVDFVGAEVQVTMKVNDENQSRITEQSRASIGSLSLLGEPIIEISPSSAGNR
jgi:hypothetical protein